MAAATIIMPMLGESVTEGVVERWLKAEGDAVQRDEPLVEVSTDKVTAEIPSPAAGTLARILVQPGQTVPVNTPIAVLSGVGAQEPGAREGYPDPKQPSSAPGSTRAAQAGTQPAPPLPDLRPPTSGTREEAARQRSTPLVRRLAAQQGIALSAVQGAGFGGRPDA